MPASRMLTPAVFAFGALLVLVGLLVISAGLPVIRMEIGWSEVIGGAVVGSAGCVILVLGVVLIHLDALQRSLARLAPVAPLDVAADDLVLRPTLQDEPEAEAVRPPHPLSPAHRRDAPVPVLPEPPLPELLHPSDEVAPMPVSPSPAFAAERDEPVLDAGAPALVAAETASADSLRLPSVEAAAFAPPPAPVVIDAPVRARPSRLGSLLARRGSANRPAAVEPRAAIEPTVAASAAPATPPRSSVDLSTGWDDEEPMLAPPAHLAFAPPRLPAMEPIEAPEAEHAPALEAAPADPVVPEEEMAAHHEPPPPIETPVPEQAMDPDPLAPVVVGRYNAGSASYVMYSNGMIEVETEHGTHQFASMQDLKAFIEKRETRVG